MGALRDLFGDFWNSDQIDNDNGKNLQELGLSETSNYIKSLEELVSSKSERGRGKEKKTINPAVQTRKRVVPQKNIAHKMVEEDYERDK